MWLNLKDEYSTIMIVLSLLKLSRRKEFHEMFCYGGIQHYVEV